MKVLLRYAIKSINSEETWLYYTPLEEYIKTDCRKGFKNGFYLYEKRHRIEKNIIDKLELSWFTSPIDIYYKHDKNNILVISKIKNGDKIIK